MKKTEDVKQAILEAGLEMAGQLSLESISIGALAKATNMSKSGLFGHFQSKENLQIMILEHASRCFADSVILPALKIEAGIPRIRAIVNNWNEYGSKLSGGCIFVHASTEFSGRPGKVKECLLAQQKEWIDCLKRIAQSAVKAGDFREDIDYDQFAFDLYALLLGFYYYHELLQDSDTEKHQQVSLDRLLKDYQ